MHMCMKSRWSKWLTSVGKMGCKQAAHLGAKVLQGRQGHVIELSNVSEGSGMSKRHSSHMTHVKMTLPHIHVTCQRLRVSGYGLHLDHK